MSLGTLFEFTTLFPPWLLRVAVLAFGLLWGSFLNVVIYRVPREMSVVRPASHCPGCGKPIAGYDNVPVFTFLLLRGRARCCGVKMSLRYPLVELLGGLISLAIVDAIVFKMPGSTPLARALAVYGADFALCLGLVAAAFIDAEHMFLPDSITLGGIIVGLATATLRGLPLTTSLLGAAVGFTAVWLPFIVLYKGLLGRTGMGLGDAKLLALAGAWFGWPGALFVLFGGAVQGTLYAAALKIVGVEPTLPQAVLDDIAELEKAAAAGDEEAKAALEQDPLTENGEDAFIWRWLGLRTKTESKADELASALARELGHGPADARDARAEAPRARIPFGPFLILACFELLFAGDWIEAHFFGPI